MFDTLLAYDLFDQKYKKNYNIVNNFFFNIINNALLFLLYFKIYFREFSASN